MTPRQDLQVEVLTIMRVSEATLEVTAKDWHRVREAISDGRKANRNMDVVSFDAIVAAMERNGFRRGKFLFGCLLLGLNRSDMIGYSFTPQTGLV